MSKKTIYYFITAGIILIILSIYFLGGNPASQDNKFLSRLFPEREDRAISITPSEKGVLLEKEGAAALPPEKAQLTQVTQSAVAGATFYNGKVRFIEKATGHLYETGPQGESLMRLSNTTIPKIFEVSWSPKKDRAVLKYLQDDNLRIFSAFFNGSSTQGIFLSPQITAVATSPDEDKIFYIMPAGNSHVGIIASFEDKNKKQVFSLPFGDFVASWPAKNFISLATRPSAATEGFLYAVDIKSGVFNKIIGGMYGLEALWSPKGDKVLISDSPNPGNMELAYFDLKQKSISPIQIQTLAEKCAWSQKEENAVYCGAPFTPVQAALPDDWFKGATSFVDRVVKINIKSGEAESISTETIFYFIDLTNPFLSDDESFLFFINKTDGTLWSLKLK